MLKVLGADCSYTDTVVTKLPTIKSRESKWSAFARIAIDPDCSVTRCDFITRFLVKIFLAIPRCVCPPPYDMFQAEVRFLDAIELVSLDQLIDPIRQRREQNGCMLCKKSGTNKLLMPLCCLSFVCWTCISEFFQSNDFRCPYCDIQLSAIENVLDVLLQPETSAPPNNKTDVRKFVKQWKELVYSS